MIIWFKPMINLIVKVDHTQYFVPAGNINCVIILIYEPTCIFEKK
jgi:hypothetical protein